MHEDWELPYYAESKMHEAILRNDKIRHIHVRACYDRSADVLISEKEKRTKKFNSHRPTVSLVQESRGLTAYVNCFPGTQYVEHYYELMSYWAQNFLTGVSVSADLSDHTNLILKELDRSNIRKMPRLRTH